MGKKLKASLLTQNDPCLWIKTAHNTDLSFPTAKKAKRKNQELEERKKTKSFTAVRDLARRDGFCIASLRGQAVDGS
eukprot:3154793-Rhodomonas_salina.2